MQIIRSFNHMLLTASLSALLVACGSTIPDAESTKRASTVPTTEANGVVTGKVGPTTTATLVASPSSKVADAAVTVPTGALALETDVSIGEAADQSAAIATEAGLTTPIVKAMAPVYIGAAAGDMPTVTQALTIILPLPIGDEALKLTQGASGKLCFLYAILTTEGWKSGIKPLTAADFVGTFLKTPILGFGYFQIAYFVDKVEAKEVTSQVRPTLKPAG